MLVTSGMVPFTHRYPRLGQLKHGRTGRVLVRQMICINN
jgi:hypothetical protein